MRMTRDGAVEENLTEGTSERISKRLEDAQLVKPHEAAAPINPEGEIKRRQPRPEELEPDREDVTTEIVQPEYKPGELPVYEAAPSVHSAVDVYHPAYVDVGRVVTDTVVSSKIRKTDAVRNVDGEAVLNQAAKTAAEKPLSDEGIPDTRKIQRLEKKSEKAHERLDAAREKLPTKKVLKKERVFDEKRASRRRAFILRTRSSSPRDRANCPLKLRKPSARLVILSSPAFTAKSMRLSRITQA